MPPTFVLVAGPNGAGKSTSAPRLLRDEFGPIEFVNADAIAKGLSSFNPEKVAVAAGRILLRRLDALQRAGETFAVETTLSGRSYSKQVKKLKADGYRFDLLFLWLPSVDLAVARVAQRVKLGGHDIPEPVIRRRYRAGLRNFFTLYRPMADSWKFYDSSANPKLLAYGDSESEFIVRPDLWHNVEGV